MLIKSIQGSTLTVIVEMFCFSVYWFIVEGIEADTGVDCIRPRNRIFSGTNKVCSLAL